MSVVHYFLGDPGYHGAITVVYYFQVILVAMALSSSVVYYFSGDPGCHGAVGVVQEGGE